MESVCDNNEVVISASALEKLCAGFGGDAVAKRAVRTVGFRHEFLNDKCELAAVPAAMAVLGVPVARDRWQVIERKLLIQHGMGALGHVDPGPDAAHAHAADQAEA